MAERLTGSRERSEERSPRQRLRTLLAAASVALAAGAAEAGEKSPGLEADLAPVTAPAPKPRPDQLVRLLGEETAQEIRVALDECLAEVREIAAIVEADGDPEGAREELEIGTEDCADSQKRDIRLALLDSQIANENDRQVALAAERADRGAALERRRAINVELAEVNDAATRLLIDQAVCEAGGGSSEECAAFEGPIADLMARANALLQEARELDRPGEDQEPVGVTEAVPKDDDTRVASLEAERAKTQ